MASDPEDDDWAPLTPDQMVLRPGEEQDVAPVRKPHPRAEQMLRELQDRIDNTPKSDSIVASVGRREQRQRRKQAAQQDATGLADALMRCDSVPDPQLQPSVQYDRGVDGRDDREDSEWFRALPEAEQERLHGVWAQQRDKVAGSRRKKRRNGNRRMFTAWIVFVLMFTFGVRTVWGTAIGGALLCGLAWRVTLPSRGRDATVACVCYAVANGMSLAMFGRMNSGLVWNAILLIVFSMIACFDEEARRSGGFDEIDRSKGEPTNAR